MAEVVHDHDRLRALRDPVLDVRGIETQRLRIDLREHDGGAEEKACSTLPSRSGSG